MKKKSRTFADVIYLNGPWEGGGLFSMLFLGDLLTGLSVAAAGVAFLQSVSMAALCSLVISRAFSKRSLATFLAT